MIVITIFKIDSDVHTDQMQKRSIFSSERETMQWARGVLN